MTSPPPAFRKVHDIRRSSSLDCFCFVSRTLTVFQTRLSSLRVSFFVVVGAILFSRNALLFLKSTLSFFVAVLLHSSNFRIFSYFVTKLLFFSPKLFSQSPSPNKDWCCGPVVRSSTHGVGCNVLFNRLLTESFKCIKTDEKNGHPGSQSSSSHETHLFNVQCFKVLAAKSCVTTAARSLPQLEKEPSRCSRQLHQAAFLTSDSQLQEDLQRHANEKKQYCTTRTNRFQQFGFSSQLIINYPPFFVVVWVYS